MRHPISAAAGVLALALFAWAALTPMPARAQAPAKPDAAVSLRPHWRKGQTAHYSFWNKRVTTTRVSIPGHRKKVSQTMETRGRITWKVRRVHGDGSATCAMTIDWMTATLTGPDGKPHNVDSREAASDAPPIHDLLASITGEEIEVEVASDGHVESVSHTDAMRRKAKHPKLIPSDLDFIETATELAVLPDAPRSSRVGRSWKAKLTWSQRIGKMVHHVRYTLASVQPTAGIPLATVQYHDKLALRVDRSKIPDNAPPIDVNLLKGEAHGQVLFDLSRHEAVGRNSVQTQSIEIRIHLPQQTLTRRIDRTEQDQILRLSEGTS